MDTTPAKGPLAVFWLESNQHFDLLSDGTRLEILENLFVASTVAEVAGRMAVPRTRLYHHFNLLERAGMIRVADTRRAGAQTEKIYQIGAYSFQPSEEFMKSALPREKAQAVIKSILGSTEADFVRSVENGQAPLEDDRSSRRTHLGRRLLLLNEERLHEFITELETLLERYDIEPGQLERPIPDDVKVVGVLSLVYPSSRRLI